jgi:hypothetical protein
MTDEKKPLKIEFAPGCFDSFEGTQEELDALQAEIMRMFESGEIEQNAVQLDLDTLMEEDPEMADALMRSLGALDGEDLADEFKRKLQ